MSNSIEPERPTAASVHEGRNAGDDAMQDDLTEAREVSPQKREDVAQDTNLDP